MPPLNFVVDRKEGGQTLAAVLKMRFGLSWAHAKRLVEGRHVRVGQQVVDDIARRVKTGKRVQVDAWTVEKPKGVRSPEAGVGKTLAGLSAPVFLTPDPCLLTPSVRHRSWG